MTTNPSALDAVTSHSPASSPELPDEVAIADGTFNSNASLGSPLYTADQMNAYGLACYEAGSAAAAQAVPEAGMAVNSEKTTIGLDYDGTITRDPDMWHAVMRLMQSRGHEVHIVTMRHGVESTMGHAPMEQRFLDDADGVHFTGNSETGDRDAKRPHMDAKGIEIHVWIDDNPKAVHMSAREIWGWCTNSGDPMLHSAPEVASPAPSASPHQGADALREDAERYRWLRDKSVPPHNFYISVPAEFDGVRYTPDEVDAGIDAARAALAQHQAPQQGEQQ